MALTCSGRADVDPSPVWIVGDGRSGTTWLAEMLCGYLGARMRFEPFHPTLVPAARGVRPHHYLRPGTPNPDLERFADTIFSGRECLVRVDRIGPSLFRRRLLVKDIFANLLVPWMKARRPAIRTVLLVLSPFAVASSKLALSGWQWHAYANGLLGQRELMEDALAPYERELRDPPADPWLNQVLVWSALHRATLDLALPHVEAILPYEHVRKDPSGTLGPVLAGWTGETPRDSEIRRLASVASATSRKASAARAGEPVPPERAAEGLAILRRFGVDRLYPDGLQPGPEWPSPPRPDR